MSVVDVIARIEQVLSHWRRWQRLLRAAEIVNLNIEQQELKQSEEFERKDKKEKKGDVFFLLSIPTLFYPSLM